MAGTSSVMSRFPAAAGRRGSSDRGWRGPRRARGPSRRRRRAGSRGGRGGTGCRPRRWVGRRGPSWPARPRRARRATWRCRPSKTVPSCERLVGGRVHGRLFVQPRPGQSRLVGHGADLLHEDVVAVRLEHRADVAGAAFGPPRPTPWPRRRPRAHEPRRDVSRAAGRAARARPDPRLDRRGPVMPARTWSGRASPLAAPSAAGVSARDRARNDGRSTGRQRRSRKRLGAPHHLGGEAGMPRQVFVQPGDEAHPMVGHPSIRGPRPRAGSAVPAASRPSGRRTRPRDAADPAPARSPGR